jgi:hypothetical protein
MKNIHPSSVASHVIRMNKDGHLIMRRPYRISEDNCITNVLPSPLINDANPISLQNLYVIDEFPLNQPCPYIRPLPGSRGP